MGLRPSRLRFLSFGRKERMRSDQPVSKSTIEQEEKGKWFGIIVERDALMETVMVVWSLLILRALAENQGT